MKQYLKSGANFVSHWSAVVFAFFLPLSTGLMNVFFVLAFASNIVAGDWRNKWRSIKQIRVAMWSLLFFAFMLLSVSYSHGSTSHIIYSLKHYSHLLLGATLLPLFIEHKWRQRAMVAFFIAMFVVTVFSYFVYFNIWYHGYRGDVAAVFKSHIEISFLLAFTVYILAIMFVHNKQHRWWLGPWMILILYNLLFMNSGRTGYVVITALTILFVCQQFNWRKLLFVMMLLSSVMWLSYHFSPTFYGRVVAVSQNIAQFDQGKNNTPVGLRLTFLQSSIKLAKQHPIFGTGIGSFFQDYSELNPTLHTAAQEPANEYLNVLVQFGALGLALLLILFIIHWRDSHLLPKPWNWLAGGVVVSFAVGCFFNSWLIATTEGHFYSFFVALLFASFLDTKSLKCFHQKTFRRQIFCYNAWLTPEMKILLNNPKHWLKTNDSHYFKNKSQDTTTVAKTALAGKDIVIKCYNFRNFWHGLKLRFRSSGAMRSWVNAHYLLGYGISTVKPIAMVEERWLFFRGRSYFISEYVPGIEGDIYFKELTGQWQVALVSIETMIKQMCNAKISHQDFRLGNMLIYNDRPVLLDLDHVRRHHWQWYFRRLHRADIEHFLIFMKRDHINLYPRVLDYVKIT